jgi:hypothetical protein
MSKASDASTATAAAAAPTPTRTRLYRDGGLALEGFPAEDISEHLATPGSVVWLDLCAPTAADFDMINAEFGRMSWPSRTRCTNASAPSSTATPITCSSAPTRSTWTPRLASWRQARSRCSSPARR